MFRSLQVQRDSCFWPSTIFSKPGSLLGGWWGEESNLFFLHQWKILTNISPFPHTGPGSTEQSFSILSSHKTLRTSCFNFQTSHFILKLLLPLHSFWSHLVLQNFKQGEKTCGSEGSWPFCLCVCGHHLCSSLLQVCTRAGGRTMQFSNSLLSRCH